ncbi:hypothetical protein COO60DRAFT_675889 [Scenedesmus sp. NREL 46B-D3]|nr:hypothetical protein COO60DRAFT_675889 [Scenedesmus sp. NREL 46B-D3]
MLDQHVLCLTIGWFRMPCVLASGLMFDISSSAARLPYGCSAYLDGALLDGFMSHQCSSYTSAVPGFQEIVKRCSCCWHAAETRATGLM